jgi:cell division protein FtsZ
MFELDVDHTAAARLKVVGVGGAGGNAINRMIGAGLRGVEFIVANTDLQALSQSLAPTRVQIGVGTTRGLGSGGDPTQGRRSAEEDEQAIADALADSDMVFIAAGMGGGTGTGAAPVVARVAKKLGALTVAVVTKPFSFEGRRRMRQADEGLAELRAEVDTLLVIPNERLLSVVEKQTSFTEAFGICDEVLLKATKGVSDLVTVPGIVNLDFADVKSVMTCRGNALMGTGRARGESRAHDAAAQAVSSPLLEDVSIHGAEGVLVNITGGRDLTLHEVNEAANVVTQAAGDDANVIFGAVIDPNLDGELVITVVATGFGATAPALKLVERPRATAAGAPAADAEDAEDYRRPAWQRHRDRAQWGRDGSRGESLQVPAFLRKQMD